MAEITGISGEEGNFEVIVTQSPRFVDLEKCIACGLCAEKCPKKVSDDYNGGLIKRKSIYVQYAQAVPLKYVIDPDNCIYLNRKKCKACEKFCPTGAILFEEQKKELSLNVGAIILATGSRAFDPKIYDTYGYQKSPNILTSLEFERVLSASGPYGGHLVRPSDKKEPEKIAWLQCIGSRDEQLTDRGYCSGVCCTYAIKEAILAKEHSKGGPSGSELDAAIFYIDIRTYGKDFEKYYNHAKNDLGVRFIKSKITNVEPANQNGKHQIHYVDETGKSVEEEFDIVVLSVGLGVRLESENLARILEVELNHYNFASTSSFTPVQSSRPGIYVCGVFQGPKDIPASVIDASAAAGEVGAMLSESRWTHTKTKDEPEQVNISGEPPRIGVFVCSCGTNIAGTVDVTALVESAKDLSGVVYTENNLFSCSQDTQENITRTIKEQQLNRVVVAACTPKTHEPLFQDTLTSAGLNKYLFEMVNIRNQCSWVHKSDMETSTAKADDLIRMAVAKVTSHESLEEPTLKINKAALVIGGGVSGITAAVNLAQQGYQTYVIEKANELGGQALNLSTTWRGEKIQHFLTKSIEAVQNDQNIDVFLNCSIKKVEGFIGNFKTTITCNNEDKILEHGITIIATGASEFKPDQYSYNKDPRVKTNMELEKILRDNSSVEPFNTVVFMQCVGSRVPERPYCSKVCCTQSIKNALKIKEADQSKKVFILYRDMRSYGLREDLYRKARSAGIKFIRYDFSKGLEVNVDEKDLQIVFNDRVLLRRMQIHTDLLVLATAIIPEKNNPLAQFFKVPQNDDGFFMEVHVKLQPNDFATGGMFVCGLAHAPKPIDESIAQAQAAAARAVTVLSSETISVSGTVASVDQMLCSECGVCVSICPYSAPEFKEKTGKAKIQSTLCKGCGLCVASCRSGAIMLKGFETSQIMNMISSLMSG